MYKQDILNCSVPGSKLAIAESSRYKRKTDGVWETYFQVFAISDEHVMFLRCFTTEKDHLGVWNSIEKFLAESNINDRPEHLDIPVKNASVKDFSWFPLANTQTVKNLDYGDVELSFKLEINDRLKTIKIDLVEHSNEFLQTVRQGIANFIVKEAKPELIPMTRSEAVTGPGCCLFVTLLGMFFFLFAGAGAQIRGGRSGLIRSIASGVTELVTPGGIAIIGAAILLICIFLIVSRLIKPPNEEQYFLNGAAPPEREHAQNDG